MIPKKRDEEDRHIRTRRWQKQDIRYHERRIIVKFKAPPADSDVKLDDMLQSVAEQIPGGRVLRRPKASGRALFYVGPEGDVLKLATELSKRDDVEYAEPDVMDREAVVPSDTRFVDQWALATVGAEDAWNLETGSSTNVLIGIIDSGISMTGNNLDHPDLNDAGRYILGTDYVDGGVPRDLRGHGTHVTGIAAAETNNATGVAGMNWNTPVYICRTLDANGNGSSADFADAVEEIVDFAIANGYHAVINYSAGGGANLTKQNACQYADTNGMILCAATGNDNAGPVIFPAAYSTMFNGVIAVGSTDDTDTVSSFSNVGPEVTVVAPGRNILSTMPTYAVTIPAALNYDELDGTSMATPLVTGLVALMWSRHPGFTNTAIRNCLTSTAVKLGPGNFDNAWGFGRVDAEAALRCGDLPFFTGFTIFTRWTLFTRFTRFTFLTRFTRFTFFTRLTRFTPIIRFTPFTFFTRFKPYTRFFGFDKPVEPLAFVRVGKNVFDLREIELSRFKDFQAVLPGLRAAKIDYLHQLAACDVDVLSKDLQCRREDAATLVAMAQQLLTQIAGD